jgi:hypothetical protein
MAMRNTLRKISLLLIGLALVNSALSASMLVSNVKVANAEQHQPKCHEKMLSNDVSVHKAPLSGCYSHCSMSMSHAVLSLNKILIGNEVSVFIVNSKNIHSPLLDQHASPLYRPPIVVS